MENLLCYNRLMDVGLRAFCNGAGRRVFSDGRFKLTNKTQLPGCVGMLGARATEIEAKIGLDDLFLITFPHQIPFQYRIF